MKPWRIVVEDLIASRRRLRTLKSRGPRRVELSCDPLEERVTPSHLFAGHLTAAVHVPQQVAHHSSGAPSTLPIKFPPSTLGNWGPTPLPVTPPSHGGHNPSTNSALQTALKNLQPEVQTIEGASGTTVAELTAIKVAFRTLATAGLRPTSQSDLSSFENSLVTTNATTPGSITSTGASYSTLLTQFTALYTSSATTLTTQQTTDLGNAYSALAAAVTSAGVTQADINNIDTAWAAVQAALPSTSTAAVTTAPTFPYFTLVTGQGGVVCIGPIAF